MRTTRIAGVVLPFLPIRLQTVAEILIRLVLRGGLGFEQYRVVSAFLSVERTQCSVIANGALDRMMRLRAVEVRVRRNGPFFSFCS